MLKRLEGYNGLPGYTIISSICWGISTELMVPDNSNTGLFIAGDVIAHALSHLCSSCRLHIQQCRCENKGVLLQNRDLAYKRGADRPND